MNESELQTTEQSNELAQPRPICHISVMHMRVPNAEREIYGSTATAIMLLHVLQDYKLSYNVTLLSSSGPVYWMIVELAIGSRPSRLRRLLPDISRELDATQITVECGVDNRYLELIIEMPNEPMWPIHQ